MMIIVLYIGYRHACLWRRCIAGTNGKTVFLPCLCLVTAIRTLEYAFVFQINAAGIFNLSAT